VVSAGVELDSDALRHRGRCPELEADEVRAQLRKGLVSGSVPVDPVGESPWTGPRDPENAYLEVFRQMVRAGAPESIARELVQHVYDLEEAAEVEDPLWVRAAVARCCWACSERPTTVRR